MDSIKPALKLKRIITYVKFARLQRGTRRQMVIAAKTIKPKPRLSRCQNYDIDKNIARYVRQITIAVCQNFIGSLPTSCLPSRIDIRRFGERRLQRQPSRLTSSF
jgi:hypothetical protein